MPRTCTICTHPNRTELDKALVGTESFRTIADRFDVTESALKRHKASHVPKLLAKAARSEQQAATALAEVVADAERAEVAHARNVYDELEKLFVRVNLLFDACDRWLRDADDPSRYDIGPRAFELNVTYTETVPCGKGTKVVVRKDNLQRLLDRATGVELDPVYVETKRSDPRKLALEAATTLKGQIETLAKLMGQLQEGGTVVNVLASPEWVQVQATMMRALAPYAEARVAVAAALAKLESGARIGA